MVLLQSSQNLLHRQKIGAATIPPRPRSRRRWRHDDISRTRLHTEYPPASFRSLSPKKMFSSSVSSVIILSFGEQTHKVHLTDVAYFQRVPLILSSRANSLLFALLRGIICSKTWGWGRRMWPVKLVSLNLLIGIFKVSVILRLLEVALVHGHVSE